MRLWIDTDMGFDDLAAIGLCRSLGAQIAGLSLVAGNAPLSQVIANAQDSLAAFGWDIALYTGASGPIAAKADAPLETADYVLGQSGILTMGCTLPAAARPRALTGCAQEGLYRYLSQGADPILALGPLTNLAQFVQSHPELAPHMRVIWMGGAFARGNHSAVAEFNAALDPEAINIVLAAGVDLTMVGLECCREVSVTLDQIAPLRAHNTQGSALIADLYEAYIRIAANGTRPMALYDPVAAALALRPDWAHYQPVHMIAETQGTYTRGMTVIEWRAHKAVANIKVATTPNAEAMICGVTAALEQMINDYDAHC